MKKNYEENKKILNDYFQIIINNVKKECIDILPKSISPNNFYSAIKYLEDKIKSKVYDNRQLFLNDFLKIQEICEQNGINFADLYNLFISSMSIYNVY